MCFYIDVTLPPLRKNLFTYKLQIVSAIIFHQVSVGGHYIISSLHHTVRNISIVMFWNYTTIPGLLQNLHYYYRCHTGWTLVFLNRSPILFCFILPQLLFCGPLFAAHYFTAQTSHLVKIKSIDIFMNLANYFIDAQLTSRCSIKYFFRNIGHFTSRNYQIYDFS